MEEKNQKNLTPRPPIVVVMGHIDHGKTTLLDYIRKTKVAEKESGGITQHIGAYEIVFQDRRITFIDTPGHEAFSKMRERGSKAADIALLVVAADDGIKTQTLEALDHIQKAGLPFIAVINKIDKPGANTEKIKKEFAEKNVLFEEWGGKTPAVEISAKTGKNIDHLLELINLMADIEELKADPGVSASGFVIESHLDPKRGQTATLIITDGTLKTEDWIVIGSGINKVRSFENFTGEPVKEASFSSPILLFGFSNQPVLGEKFLSFKDKKLAQNAVTDFGKKEKDISKIIQIAEGETVSDLPAQAGGRQAVLKIILKADVLGSIEAFEEVIKKLVFKEGRVMIVKSGVGDVNIDDANFAKSVPNTLVAAFRVKIPQNISEELSKEGIEIFSSDIIYDIEDRLKEKLTAIIPQKAEIVPLGKVKILAVFKSEKNKMIVGGRVLSGKIKKGAKAKVLRNSREAGKGRIAGLKQFEKDIIEAGEGLECGILFETDIKIIADDILEVSEEMKQAKTLTPIS